MPRRVLTGTIVSNKSDKTVVVEVERKFRHPLYGKFVKNNKKYMAHDEDNVGKVGDVVTIEEHRPISKTKTWKMQSKLGAAADTAVDVE